MATPNGEKLKGKLILEFIPESVSIERHTEQLTKTDEALGIKPLKSWESMVEIPRENSIKVTYELNESIYKGEMFLTHTNEARLFFQGSGPLKVEEVEDGSQ